MARSTQKHDVRLGTFPPTHCGAPASPSPPLYDDKNNNAHVPAARRQRELTIHIPSSSRRPQTAQWRTSYHVLLCIRWQTAVAVEAVVAAMQQQNSDNDSKDICNSNDVNSDAKEVAQGENVVCGSWAARASPCLALTCAVTRSRVNFSPACSRVHRIPRSPLPASSLPSPPITPHNRPYACPTFSKKKPQLPENASRTVPPPLLHPIRRRASRLRRRMTHTHTHPLARSSRRSTRPPRHLISPRATRTCARHSSFSPHTPRPSSQPRSPPRRSRRRWTD